MTSLASKPAESLAHPLPKVAALGGCVRRIAPEDLGSLMRTVGVLVDELYPDGAAKLLTRLEDALNGYADAFVVADRRNRPIALASETAKGATKVKLSTFWVSPVYRGRGVGAGLLSTRQSSWFRRGVERAHVTVRAERAYELERLFVPRGFKRQLVVVNRYGEGLDEAVLVWRPDSKTATSHTLS